MWAEFVARGTARGAYCESTKVVLQHDNPQSRCVVGRRWFGLALWLGHRLCGSWAEPEQLAAQAQGCVAMCVWLEFAGWDSALCDKSPCGMAQVCRVSPAAPCMDALRYETMGHVSVDLLTRKRTCWRGYHEKCLVWVWAGCRPPNCGADRPLPSCSHGVRTFCATAGHRPIGCYSGQLARGRVVRREQTARR